MEVGGSTPVQHYRILETMPKPVRRVTTETATTR
jgi:hypothetical protein